MDREDTVADHQVHDLMPAEVSKGIAEGRYLLVDVREPNEVAVEAYPDGVVVPLSTFDANNIPDPNGKQVVFACGIIGWKQAGLPTRTGG
jgi:rhodanese-related sulfurtransferase